MLKIDRQKQSFSVLDTPTLADVSITERYDLQEYISNSPTEFFKEIGQELYLVGKEVVPSKTVQDRIDLLAIDKEGVCVVIELKRGNHKLHMLQSISYAGMISQWEADDFLELLDEDRQEALAEFLEVDKEDINRRQRLILIAEAYDYGLLVAAEWLSEQYGVDILCCRIAVAKDAATDSEYLVCSNVYPAPELAHVAVARGRGSKTQPSLKWPDWEAALSGIANADLVAYFKRELSASRESYLPKRILRYRLGGKRRWFMAARQKNAYVWQQGRFDHDEDFWRAGLSVPEEVSPVKKGKCLRLLLYTKADFDFFHRSATEALKNRTWIGGTGEGDISDMEIDS